ncbi:DUF1015 family protein [Pelagibacteraceae bacterium]|nr:DUF1015 family protein [Pelagibacteraceae bacterium]
MVEIKPFKGTRPYNEDAKNLIAPSTDHLSIENIEIFKKNNYWNYLKILNPVGQLKEADTLLEAKSHFNEMKENDVIKKDKEFFYYIYQIEFKGHTQLGFLSLSKISDFVDKKIKAHEKIYETRMRERAEQMLNIKTQIGPIYVVYKKNNKIKDLLSSIISNTPDYDFESFDKSIHKLWCVSDESFIKKLSSVFINEVDNFYIADGHHRMGAMKIIGELNYNKNILQEDFMIAAFPSDEAKIFDYNRVVKDLNGLSEENFLDILSENFEIKKEKNPFKPQSNKQFGMYHEKKWYSLHFKTELKTDNFVDTLDINILNNFIFKKHLNISDVNNDERIRFIAGCHGLEALEKKVDENNDSVAFSIFPSSISDVITVANKNLTMPPKSTWFDPKPLDGLVVYEFEKNV